MEFVITPTQYRFVEKRQDASKKACCRKMEVAIKGGSLGLKADKIQLDVIFPNDLDYSHLTIEYCPFCGEPITTKVV